MKLKLSGKPTDMDYMTLTAGGLELAIVLGGAAIALWLAVRFPNSGPTNPAVAIANAFASVMVGSMLVGPLVGFLRRFAVPDSLALSLIGGTLPVTTYLWLSMAWFVRSMQRLIGAYR